MCIRDRFLSAAIFQHYLMRANYSMPKMATAMKKVRSSHVPNCGLRQASAFIEATDMDPWSRLVRRYHQRRPHSGRSRHDDSPACSKVKGGLTNRATLLTRDLLSAGLRIHRCRLPARTIGPPRGSLDRRRVYLTSLLMDTLVVCHALPSGNLPEHRCYKVCLWL